MSLQAASGRSNFRNSICLKHCAVCLRKLSLNHVKNRGPLPPIVQLEFLPAGGTGTLPAEAVPEACKQQGATTANLLIGVSPGRRSRYSACGSCPCRLPPADQISEIAPFLSTASVPAGCLRPIKFQNLHFFQALCCVPAGCLRPIKIQKLHLFKHCVCPCRLPPADQISKCALF